MTISILNAVAQTWWVIGVLFVAALLSIRPKRDSGLFSLDVTTEIKGFAILLIVLSHIGYFLVDDHRFLTPLSNYAGAGVDLFLIVSGYGLVVSALRKPVSIMRFYTHRLHRVYVPVAITMCLFLVLDFFVLHRTYPVLLTIKNFFGFFPEADIYNSLNSPLWYITLLLVNYFLFPLIFWRRAPLLSAFAMAIVGWVLVRYAVPHSTTILENVAKLYKLHFISFPLGMALGVVLPSKISWITRVRERAQHIFSHARWHIVWHIAKFVFASLLLGYCLQLSPYAVGATWRREALVSVSAALAMVLFFITKPFKIGLFYLFGVFSFEIYLLHWPLVYRYNLLFGRAPAAVATILYLIFFIAISYIYSKILAHAARRLEPAVSKTK